MSLYSSRFLLPVISTIHTCLQISEGAVAMAKATTNPGNPNWCIEPSTGIQHMVGSEWNMGEICGKAWCEERGNSLYISYSTCGQAHAEYPCELVSNVTLPYPYCCPRSFCPVDPSVETNFINTEDYNDLYMASSNSIDHKVGLTGSPSSPLNNTTSHSRIQNHIHVKDQVDIQNHVNTNDQVNIEEHANLKNHVNIQDHVNIQNHVNDVQDHVDSQDHVYIQDYVNIQDSIIVNYDVDLSPTGSDYTDEDLSHWMTLFDV